MKVSVMKRAIILLCCLVSIPIFPASFHWFQSTKEDDFFGQEAYLALRRLHIKYNSCEPIALIGHSSPVFSINLINNATQVVTEASDNTVRIWDIATGKLVQTLRNQPVAEKKAVALLTNGSFAATGFNTPFVRLWDTNTGDLLKELKIASGAALSIDIANDAQYLAVGASDGTAYLWKLMADWFDQVTESLKNKEKLLLIEIFKVNEFCVCDHKATIMRTYENLDDRIKHLLQKAVAHKCDETCPGK